MVNYLEEGLGRRLAKYMEDHNVYGKIVGGNVRE